MKDPERCTYERNGRRCTMDYMHVTNHALEPEVTLETAPLPWSWERRFDRVYDANNLPVADTFGDFPEGDAQRIVLCVNALAGIEDPEAFVRMAHAHAILANEASR